MKEYIFEYTKQGIAVLLFMLSFAIIGLGACILLSLFPNNQHPLLTTILLIACAILFFWLNKSRIKRTGSARLFDSYIELELDELWNIQFSELRYYHIYEGKNGLSFTLGFHDKTKLKVAANNNFCNVAQFKAFLNVFQSAVKQYKKEHNISIIHLESIFARKNAVYVLSGLTGAVIIGYYFTSMPIMILPIAVTLPLLLNWIQYFKLKRENKLTDI